MSDDIYLRSSQLTPMYDSGHSHVYDPSPSIHTPPFWQGRLEHSLIAVKTQTLKVLPTIPYFKFRLFSTCGDIFAV